MFLTESLISDLTFSYIYAWRFFQNWSVLLFGTWRLKANVAILAKRLAILESNCFIFEKLFILIDWVGSSELTVDDWVAVFWSKLMSFDVLGAFLCERRVYLRYHLGLEFDGLAKIHWMNGEYTGFGVGLRHASLIFFFISLDPSRLVLHRL